MSSVLQFIWHYSDVVEKYATFGRSLQITGWRPRAVVVCLLTAANRGSNCSLTRAMDGRIVRCGY